MLKWLAKNKWLAFGLVAVMLFTLLPTNLNWADVAVKEPQSAGKVSFDGTTEGNPEMDGAAATSEISEDSEMPEETAEETVTEATTETITEVEAAHEQGTETAEQLGGNTETTQEDGSGSAQPVYDNAQAGTPTESEHPDGSEKTKGAAKISQSKNKAVVKASGTEDVLDYSSLVDMNLQASYKDENGEKKNVVIEKDGDIIDIPADAELSLRLDFLLEDGDIDCNKDYVYRLPDGIRVDMDTYRDLTDPKTGKSVGQVHISPDGTLTFTFYEEVVKGQKGVPFYVQFGGGFSDDWKENLGEKKLSFPTGSGNFDYNLNITEETDKEKEKEPGKVTIEKSGEVITGSDGKPRILWKIWVNMAGRDSVSAEIVDQLPKGLTYVDGSLKLNGAKGTVSGKADATGKLTVQVNDLAPGNQWDSGAWITFETTYDESLFGKITSNDSWKEVANKAVINPEGEPGDEDEGSVWVTPHVLNKRGTLDAAKGVITWTVTINQDRFDIGDTTYTDTLETGLTLDSGSIKVEPDDAGILSIDGNGFTFKANSGENRQITITYETTVENVNSKDGFTNKGNLSGGEYDVDTEAHVNGADLIDKRYVSYNSVTNEFTWEIVINKEKLPLGRDVKVKDIIPADYDGKMKVKSMSAKRQDESGIAYNWNPATGILTFLDEVKDTVIITVTTELEKSYIEELNKQAAAAGGQIWLPVGNHAEMTYSEDQTAVADVNTSFSYSKPDLLDKEGAKCKDDNTILWRVHVKKAQLTQEKLVFTDTLPKELEYVEGSFELRKGWYWTNQDGIFQVTPDYDPENNTLTYTIEKGHPANTDYFLLNNDDDQGGGFSIYYKTRLKEEYRELASEKYTYENNAEIEATYEGNVQVTDTATGTVTDTLGGTLGKDSLYPYGGQKDIVEWIVDINASHFDMKDIKSPVIYDQLASYFDYISGELYRIKKGSNEEVLVPESEYSVIIINGMLTVKLPNIGTDALRFKFRTQFNVLNEGFLPTKKIVNNVEFKGEGVSESVSSGELQNVQFNSASAGSGVENELWLVKRDASTNQFLPGAVFELFYDGVSCGTMTTDENGKAVFKGILTSSQGVEYTLREIQAPDGYKLDEDDYTFTVKTSDLKKDSKGVPYYEVVRDNTRIDAKNQISLNVHKTDNSSSEPVEGAEFTLYADPACSRALAKKTTGKDGNLSFNVEVGETDQKSFYIKETKAPDGYLADNTVYMVTVKSGTVTYDPSVNLSGKTALMVTNTKLKGKLTIYKTDSDPKDKKPLKGAVFAIYTDSGCTDLVKQAETDANGNLSFENLEVGIPYYYREISAPDGYKVDSQVYSIIFDSSMDNLAGVIEQKVEIANDSIYSRLEVVKTDDSTPTAKPLKGVVFELYEADGETPVTDADNNKITSTTNDKGVATFDHLRLGTYVVKERKAPDGYVAAADTRVTLDSADGKRITVVNKRARYSIEILKTDGTVASTPLEGVLFTLSTAAGRTVMSGRTDKAGKLTFENVPYDANGYVLKETEGIKGYSIANPSSQTITAENLLNAAGNTLNYTFKNEKQSGSILLTKKDGDGNYLEGAEFTLYDSDGDKVATATSDDRGQILFSDLIWDTYTILETKAPLNYKLDSTRWTVAVEGNTTCKEVYAVTGSGKASEIINEKLPTSVEYVAFKLKKVDRAGTGLSGAEFTFSKRKVKSADWEILQTAYSDKDGIVEFFNVGVEHDDETYEYKVEEVNPPAGYIKDSEKYYQVYSYKELTQKQLPGYDPVGYSGLKTDFTNVPVIDTYTNEQILGSIVVTKQSTVGSAKLEGAEFTLYQKDGRTPYQRDNKNYTVTTDDTGTAKFENLPLGVYVVKETKAPKGYILDTVTGQKEVPITADSTGKVINGSWGWRDTRISLSISKQSSDGTGEIEGAELAIYDSTGTTQLERWETKGEKHVIQNYDKLEVGKKYILRELKAPDGYIAAEDITFTIISDGSIRLESGSDGTVNDKTITMYDQKLELGIIKQDEKGNGLPGALLGLVDDSTGQTLYTFTSDGKEAAIPSKYLKTPDAKGEYTKYSIHEISAPENYALAEDVKFAISYEGKFYEVTEGKVTAEELDNPIRMVDEVKSGFYFAKVDGEDSSKRIPNAKLQLTGPNGDVTTWTTTNQPKKFSLDPGEYTLTEVEAPQGYKLAPQPVKFKVDGGMITIISGTSATLGRDHVTLSLADERLNVRIRKVDEALSLLTGAKFALYESNQEGDRIGAPLQIFETVEADTVLDNSKLELDEWYLLVETEPPVGYKAADPVLFQISQAGEVLIDGEACNNYIRIIDEYNGITISKQTFGGEELPGATIELRDQKNQLVYTWKSGKTAQGFTIKDNPDKNKHELAPGTYTMVETGAPQGYAYAESITFTVNEDGTVTVETPGLDGAVQNDGRKLVMKDNAIGNVTVSKKAISGADELPGASITLYEVDSNGKKTEIESWTSKTESHEIDGKKLKAGGTYVLHENAAPAGYQVTTDITFEVGTDGSVQMSSVNTNKDADMDETNRQIVIRDKAIDNIYVSKKAISGSDELPGAEITLYEIDGNGNETIIDSWTSGSAPHEIDGKKLKAGYRYKLHEEAAPDGYKVTTDIIFEIGLDGSVQMSSVNTNSDAEIDEAGRQIVIRDRADAGKEEKKEKEKKKKDDDETGTKTATRTDSKKTGDSAPIPFAGTLFFLSLAGAGTAYGLRRKKARKK